MGGNEKMFSIITAWKRVLKKRTMIIEPPNSVPRNERSLKVRGLYNTTGGGGYIERGGGADEKRELVVRGAMSTWRKGVYSREVDTIPEKNILGGKSFKPFDVTTDPGGLLHPESERKISGMINGKRQTLKVFSTFSFGCRS